MRIRSYVHTVFLPHAILWAAAFLVPAQSRTEWLAEWKAELWYVCHTPTAEPQSIYHQKHNEVDALSFCMGAFEDGLWLRRNHPRPTPWSVSRPGYPSRCVYSLAVLLLLSLSLAAHLPNVRRVILPSPYRNVDSPVMISRGESLWSPTPSVRFSEYQAWKNNAQQTFSNFAFYKPAVSRIQIAPNKTAELAIAGASDNLLKLLQIPLESGAFHHLTNDDAVELVLSHEAWEKYFDAAPNIVGQLVDLAGQPVLIAGVASANSWRLPGKMDGWLLENQQRLATVSSNSKGFMLAKVKDPSFILSSDGQFEITATTVGGSRIHYRCMSVAKQCRQPLALYLFALVLACLSLPATTALPLGEYPASSDRLAWTTRMRRWIFLITKISLILPIVYFVSMDLAYFSYTIHPVYAQYIQLGTTFPAFLFAFRWALRDQRKRCPVCLCLLTNPARVGQSSRTFLAWNGTELICVQGHGLLHVPDISTSWFSTQRWLYLDPSWSVLFSGAHAGTL